MRLFVAVTPPAAAVRDLVQALSAELDGEPGPRWVRPEVWHLTLAFLGEVEECRLDQLTTRLARAAHRHESFTLAINGAGCFGDRVLWAGLTGDRCALVSLAATVVAAARRSGIVLEDRPYRPHLTLARGTSGVNLRPWVHRFQSYVGPSWIAAELRLVESRLGAGPGHAATHVLVRSWSMGTAKGDGDEQTD